MSGESVLLKYTAFNEEGSVVASGQISLPDWLDWASIEEKAVYLGYLGGMEPTTEHVLLDSQQSKKLFPHVESDWREPTDFRIHKRKVDNGERYTEEECKRRGIVRERRRANQ